MGARCELGDPLSPSLAAAAAAEGNSIYRNLVCSGVVLGLQSSGQLQQRSGGSFYLISDLWNQALPTLLSSSHQQWKLYNGPDNCMGQKGNIPRAKTCPTTENADSSMPSTVQQNTVRTRALLCSLGRLEFTVCRLNTVFECWDYRYVAPHSGKFRNFGGRSLG